MFRSYPPFILFRDNAVTIGTKNKLVMFLLTAVMIVCFYSPKNVYKFFKHIAAFMNFYTIFKEILYFINDV